MVRRRGRKPSSAEDAIIPGWFQQRDNERKVEQQKKQQKRDSWHLSRAEIEEEKRQQSLSADRLRKSQQRLSLTSPEKQKQRNQASKSTEKRRESATTPEKQQQRDWNRKSTEKRRESATTPEKQQQRDWNRKSTEKRRESATTPEKQQQRDWNSKSMEKRRESATTPEKQQQRDWNSKSTEKRRESATTPEKQQQRDWNSKSMEKRRESATTPEQQQQRELSRELMQKNRETVTSPVKDQRKRYDRKRKQNSCQLESSQEKAARRDLNAASQRQCRNNVGLSPMERKILIEQRRRKNREEAKARRDRFATLKSLQETQPNPDMGTDQLDAEEVIQDGTKDFHYEQSNLWWKCCDHCEECFPSLKLRNIDGEKWCNRCAALKGGDNVDKFTAANLMHDDRPVPDCLKNMTVIEQILIARHVPMMQVYRLPYGQYAYGGNVISFPQDVQEIADVLPRLSKDCIMLVLRKKHSTSAHKDFRVRRNKIQAALEFLKKFNKFYKDIEISYERLDSLPLDGQIEMPDFEVPGGDQEEAANNDSITPNCDEAATSNRNREAASATSNRNREAASNSDGTAASNRNGDAASNSDGTAASNRNGEAAFNSDGTAASNRNGDAASNSDGTAASNRNGEAAFNSDGTAASNHNGEAASTSDGTAASNRNGEAASNSDGIAASNRNGEAASVSDGTAASNHNGKAVSNNGNDAVVFNRNGEAASNNGDDAAASNCNGAAASNNGDDAVASNCNGEAASNNGDDATASNCNCEAASNNGDDAAASNSDEEAFSGFTPNNSGDEEATSNRTGKSASNRDDEAPSNMDDDEPAASDDDEEAFAVSDEDQDSLFGFEACTNPELNTEQDSSELLTETVLPHNVQMRSEKAQKKHGVNNLLFDGESPSESESEMNTPPGWPTVHGSQPLNEFQQEGLVAMAFPALFPYGLCDINDPDRKIPVTAVEYFRHLLLYKDQRFAKDSRFRYVAFNMIERRRCLAAGRMFVRQNPAEEQLNINDLRDMGKKDKEQLLKKILRYSQTLPGTKQYWYNRRLELIQMIKKRGLPTIFFTMSSADLQWPDLHRLMPEYSSKAKAVNENPLLCDWFFIQRTQMMLEKVFKKELKMVDYWGRFEFQHRGSVHFHGLAWLEGAPKIDAMDLLNNLNDQKEVVDYFDNLLACSIPTVDGQQIDPDNIPTIPKNPASIPYFKVENPDLDYLGLVTYCHTHTCRVGYCRKNEQSSCRFHFPFEKLHASRIKTVTDEKTGKKSSELELKRNHSWINSHNRRIAVTSRSNTDTQAIVDMKKVIGYVTKYVCKPELKSDMMKTLLTAATDSKFAPSDPVRQLAQRVLIRCVGDRDYSAQETMHLLMGYPQYLCSRTFISLYLKMDEEQREMDEIGGDVTLREGRIEQYRKRPKDYETVSMEEYYQFYNIGKKVTRRKKYAIVVPRGLKKVPRGSPNYENYCSNYLMFHKPFRRLNELKGNHATFSDALDDFLTHNPDEAFNLDDAVHRADENRERTTDETDDRSPEERILTEFSVLLQQNPEFMEEQVFGDQDWTNEYETNPNEYDVAKQFASSVIGASHSDSDIFEDPDITKLNAAQLTVFNEVRDHLMSQSQQPPLLKIVTGTAGTGKSFLISCLRGLLKKKVIVVGPTGVCASNVQGQTIHSALKIPIREFKDLSGPTLEQLQEKWKDVEYIILEEMSMVGQRLLNKIDRRLRQIFPQHSQEHFGRRSVIMFGDFGQLSPPGDTSLHRKPTNDPASRAGQLLYKQFRSCTILKQIVRQGGEKNRLFRELLLRVRRGDITRSDFDVLKSRFKPRRKGSLGSDTEWENALHLFSKNTAAAQHNVKNLLLQKKPIAKIEAEHTGGKTAAKASFEDCGLEQNLLLCEGAKIMLTANLNVKFGLCNGTLGTVKKIVYRTGGPPGLPYCVLCEFPSYSGPGFGGMANVFPVFPITRRFFRSDVDCSRTALPLRLAWAITIHKAQGLTLDTVVVDIGDLEFSNGLTFVALSRVRDLDGLRLARFEFSRLQQLGKEISARKGKKPQHRLHDLRSEDSRLERMEKNAESHVETPTHSQTSTRRTTHSADRLPNQSTNNVSEDNVPNIPHNEVEPTVTDAEPTVTVRKHTKHHAQLTYFPRLQMAGGAPKINAAKIGPQLIPALCFMGPCQDDIPFKFCPITEVIRNRLIYFVNSLVDFYKPVTTASTSTVWQKVSKIMGDPYDYRRMSFPCARVPPKRCINVAGDGHCFYHAISRAITGFDNYHKTLRYLLSQFIIEHKDVEIYNDLIADENLVKEVRGKEYAGELEFQWMSAMLRVNIVVFYPCGTTNPTTRPYQWVKFAPKQYITSGSNETPIDSDSSIYLYFCGVDLKQYQNPNHFCLVTHM